MLKISPHFAIIHVDFKHEVMKLSFARLDLQMSVPPDVQIFCRIAVFYILQNLLFVDVNIESFSELHSSICCRMYYLQHTLVHVFL